MNNFVKFRFSQQSLKLNSASKHEVYINTIIQTAIQPTLALYTVLNSQSLKLKTGYHYENQF